MVSFGHVRPSYSVSVLMVVLVSSMTIISPLSAPKAAFSEVPFINGSKAECTDFRLGDLLTLKENLLSLGINELLDIDITDEGWVWVDADEPFKSVTGVVEDSHVAHNDLTANHNSHDQIAIIRVDPEYLNLISDANGEEEQDGSHSKDTIEMEWETGIDPSTLSGDGEAYFPKWAWPSPGDRIWTNGHWVFDCGHATILNDEGEEVPVGDPECYLVVDDGSGNIIYVLLDKCNHYRTEIHSARAIASMRDQMFKLPETGSTPVRGIATDLYIHGESGYVASQLYCGMDIVFKDDPDGCPTSATPIADEYTFDIILPEKPASIPSAILATFVEDGPGNTIDTPPELHVSPDTIPPKVTVTIPLEGTGVTPDDVYARKIFAAWVVPPPGLKHHTLSLDKMYLHDDKDLDPGDCECTFFWLDVNRSPNNEWIRLADFTSGMDDYDDDHLLGDGVKSFTGANFDYYVSDGMSIDFGANGYDQDCMEKFFGHHHFTAARYVDCYVDLLDLANYGKSDPFIRAEASLLSQDYQCKPGSGVPPTTAGEKYTLCTNENGKIQLTTGETFFILGDNNDPIVVPITEYALYFTLDEIPLTDEDTADLSLSKTCVPGMEQTFDCTIIVNNSGPGLPRNVVVEDTLSTDSPVGSFAINTPSFTLENSYTTGPFTCSVTPPVDFTCEIGTVPVGGEAVITFNVSASQPGTFDDTAKVTTDSTDTDESNNEAKFRVIVVDIDVKPGDEKNTISLYNDKSVRVAVLGGPTFDVSEIDLDPLALDAPKFGGSTPRAPVSTNIEVVSRGATIDLILKYNGGTENPLGFMSTDTLGCLTGKLKDGTPILGCDPVTIRS